MTRWTRRGVLLGGAGLLAGCATRPLQRDLAQRELTVMSSGGFFAAYSELLPEWERRTGVRVTTLKGASGGGAPDSIPERLKRGEAADVVILSARGFEGLVSDGYADGGSRRNLAESLVGMAVREGAAVPDISTPEAFRRVLREASSIGYSASASGRYLSTELWPRMGVWEAIRAKAVRVESERVAAVVARGDLEIGFQQVSEILPIPGAAFAGPIPEALQKRTLFVAGLLKNSGAARSLLDHLDSEAAHATIRRTGMEPTQ